MPDLPSFLFGSILTIGKADLWLLAGLSIVVTAIFTLFYRSILSVSFDNCFARSQHLPVTFIEYMMMALIAMTIVSTLRMVGIVLAISLLTIPQMTANLFTYSFKRMIGLSIVIGWADCLILCAKRSFGSLHYLCKYHPLRPVQNRQDTHFNV